MARRAARSLLVTIASMGLIAGLSWVFLPASASDDPSAWTQGTLLSQPIRPADGSLQPPRIGAPSNSPSYFLDGPSPAEEGVPTHTIREIADGSIIRTFAVDVYSAYEVHGSSLVETQTEANGNGGKVVVTDAASGHETFTYPISSDDHLVGAGAAWVLVCHVDNSTQNCPMRLVTKSGLDTLIGITGTPQSRLQIGLPTAENFVVESSDGKSWIVSLADGTKSELGLAHPQFAASGRYFEVVSDTQLKWSNADGSATGAVTVPGAESRYFVPLGSGMALMKTSVNADGLQSAALGVVNLKTGSVGAPFVTGIGSARSMPDGHILVRYASGDHVSIKTIDGSGTAHDVAELPSQAQEVKTLTLSNGVIGASFEQASWVERSLYFASLSAATAPATGIGTPWSRSLMSGLQAPAVDSDSSDIQTFSGRVIQSRPTLTNADRDRTFRLTWSGGRRDYVSANGNGTLGSGGKLLLRGLIGSDGQFNNKIGVEDAKTGQSKGFFASDVPVALDQTWVWSVKGTNIVGFDTASPSTRTVPIGDGCATRLDVVGRWALVYCQNAVRVVDLSQIYSNWQVPISTLNLGLEIGDGFVTWAEPAARTVGSHPHLKVASLFAGHEVRGYGPLSDKSAEQGGVLAVDDSGAASLVYQDATHRLRGVSTTWAIPDATAPSTPVFETLDRVSTEIPSSATLNYSATDDQGPITYDVQYLSMLPHTPANQWTSEPAWLGTSATSASKSIVAGDDLCFRVRARDAFDNVSDWSLTPCIGAPFDDRQLSSKGSISRKPTSSTLGNTETQLLKKGAYLTKTKQVGTSVVVVAYRGSGEGALKVYIGSKSFGTINLKNSTAGWVSVTLKASKAYSGTLKVLSSSGKRARVDGVAVLH